jgi:hypothetical protein
MRSHGSLSLPFVMKVMVCHFVSNSHEVMIGLIVVLPIIVFVEISLQLHQAFLVSFSFGLKSYGIFCFKLLIFTIQVLLKLWVIVQS